MIMYDWLRISGVWSILRGVEHYYLEFFMASTLGRGSLAAADGRIGILHVSALGIWR